MPKRTLIIVLLAVIVLVVVGLFVALRAMLQPEEVDLKSTPFFTHEGMLGVDVTARRLTSPSIDDMFLLEQGRVSTSVPGDGRIKLLNAVREELFVLDFEVSYTTTSSGANLRDEVLLTFVLPYSPEVEIVRVETPQGSAEQTVPRDDNRENGIQDAVEPRN